MSRETKGVIPSELYGRLMVLKESMSQQKPVAKLFSAVQVEEEQGSDRFEVPTGGERCSYVESCLHNKYPSLEPQKDGVSFNPGSCHEIYHPTNLSEICYQNPQNKKSDDRHRPRRQCVPIHSSFKGGTTAIEPLTPSNQQKIPLKRFVSPLNLDEVVYNSPSSNSSQAVVVHDRSQLVDICPDHRMSTSSISRKKEHNLSVKEPPTRNGSSDDKKNNKNKALIYPQFSNQVPLDYPLQLNDFETPDLHPKTYIMQIEEIKRRFLPNLPSAATPCIERNEIPQSVRGDRHSNINLSSVDDMILLDQEFIEEQRRTLKSFEAKKRDLVTQNSGDAAKLHISLPEIHLNGHNVPPYDQATLDLSSLSPNTKTLDLSNSRSSGRSASYPVLPECNEKGVATPFFSELDPHWRPRIFAAGIFSSRARSYAHLDSTIWSIGYTFVNALAYQSCALESSKGPKAKLDSDLHCNWQLIASDSTSNRQHPIVGGTPKHYHSPHLTHFIDFSSDVLAHSIVKMKNTNDRTIQQVLYDDEVDLEALRSLCLKDGVPKRLRAFIWQLMLGYIPKKSSERSSRLRDQRLAYLDLVDKFMTDPLSGQSEHEIFRLVMVDVPRTHPEGFCDLFATPIVQSSLERILIIWSHMHKRISYYQGLNDLTAILLVVFLDCCLGDLSDEHLGNPTLPLNDLKMTLWCVECDVYHCLTLLLDGIEVYHPFDCSGVYSEYMVAHLESLVQRIDPVLYRHIRDSEVEFIHFTLRWMLCLFTRELGTKNLVCLWDSCIIEGGRGFSELHIFICAAYLLELAPKLMGGDMPHMMNLLQHAPTGSFSKYDVHRLVHRARELMVQYPLNIEPHLT